MPIRAILPYSEAHTYPSLPVAKEAFGTPLLCELAQDLQDTLGAIQAEEMALLIAWALKQDREPTEVERRARLTGSLAAPSMGVFERVILVSAHIAPWGPIALINPEVIETAGPFDTAWERCASFQGVLIPVQRPSFIRMRTVTMGGISMEQRVVGPVARAILHEIDVLDGRWKPVRPPYDGA